jgi:NADP+-dependent farnesol dehydrogenase
MDKWLNKTAVITGGSSGMGAAILAKFVEHGLRVINLDVSVAENGTSHDGKVFNRKCNVASLESIRENFAWIEEQFGVINVLINCAGICSLVDMTDLSDENTATIERTIDVNLKGTIRCTREAMRLMVKSDEFCMLINLCSIYGHVIPYTGNSVGAYSCTKHAIKAFSEVLRQELTTSQNDKIRVTNVSPSSVITNMWRGFKLPDEFIDSMNFLRPDDVADAVVYLLSTPCSVNVTELVIRPVGERF